MTRYKDPKPKDHNGASAGSELSEAHTPWVMVCHLSKHGPGRPTGCIQEGTGVEESPWTSLIDVIAMYMCAPNHHLTVSSHQKMPESFSLHLEMLHKIQVVEHELQEGQHLPRIDARRL